jgi:hypothetical protein
MFEDVHPRVKFRACLRFLCLCILYRFLCNCVRLSRLLCCVFLFCMVCVYISLSLRLCDSVVFFSFHFVNFNTFVFLVCVSRCAFDVYPCVTECLSVRTEGIKVCACVQILKFG